MSLCIVCMTAIFLFSAQNGDTSNNTSNFVITLLEQQFHLDIEKLSPSLLEMLSFVVRKCAHMSEYALLCILWVLYMKEAHFTKAYMLAYGLTVIYAVSDEIHQAFVPGRSAQLSDVCIDACGAAIGLLMICLWCRWRQRKYQTRAENSDHF